MLLFFSSQISKDLDRDKLDLHDSQGLVVL